MTLTLSYEKYFPWYEKRSSVHALRMISSCSNMRSRLSPYGTPKLS